MKKNYKLGIAATYVCYFINFIVTFIFTPFIIKNVTQTFYGIYQISLSIAAFLLILNFGIPNSFIRFYSIEKLKSKSDIKSLNSGYFFTMIAVSCIILIVGLILTFFVCPIVFSSFNAFELETFYKLNVVNCINAALTTIVSAFETYFYVHEKYHVDKISNCIHFCLSTIISTILMVEGYPIYYIVCVTLLFTSLKLVFSFYYSRQRLGFSISAKCIDFSQMKTLYAYAIFIFINIVSDQVNWSIDRFLLGSMVGPNSSAIYSVASQIQSMYMQMMIAISAVFVTKINNLISSGNNKEASELFVSVGRYQFMLSGLIIFGFITYGKQFISFWAGNEYGNAYYIAIILLISATPLYIQNIGTEIQRAKNLHKFRAFVYLFMSIFNLFISIVLIKMFDETGAAIGTAIALIIGDGLITNYYYKKAVHLPVKEFWTSIVKITPAFIPIIVISIINKFFIVPIDFIHSIPHIVVFTLVYLLSIYLFVLDKTEKDKILCIFRKDKLR